MVAGRSGGGWLVYSRATNSLILQHSTVSHNASGVNWAELASKYVRERRIKKVCLLALLTLHGFLSIRRESRKGEKFGKYGQKCDVNPTLVGKTSERIIRSRITPPAWQYLPPRQ